MHVPINVSEEDIAYAEEILLKEGGSFDNERRVYLKDFTTLDLQAVPGSGKTTILLAKLLILEKHLPFIDNSGIVVLSHTNIAVDEIKMKLLKFCPKLFSYPNFIGTIQSFVDMFLCAPYYFNRYKSKIHRIDDEIYEESHYMPQGCKGYLDRRRDSKKVLLKSRLYGDDDLNYSFGETGSLPFKNKTSGTYRELVKLKKSLRLKGLLSFDDAYILADEYLLLYPRIIKILQCRFKYVFVDEMQDMNKHQYDILEKLFYNDSVIYQRIGDKNQAIFNGKDKINENVWINRDNLLNLNGSHRLSKPISELVNCFAVEVDLENQIQGLGEGNIKPHMIIFNKNSILQVLYKFSELIKSFDEKGFLKINVNSQIKAIACRKENDGDKIGLSNYFPEYNTERNKQSLNFNALESYLYNLSKNLKTLNEPRRNILNALIKIIRLENINDYSDKFYTKSKLIEFMKEKNESAYGELKINLYQWSIGLIRGDNNNVLNKIRDYIPKLLDVFSKTIIKSKRFIFDSLNIIESVYDEKIANHCNKFNIHGFDVEVTTIHSVKGQTHLATLLVETDSFGSSESIKLHEQFKYIHLKGNERIRVNESARLTYVAFSRPTHLLCIAILKDRFDQYLSGIDRSKWEIVYVS